MKIRVTLVDVRGSAPAKVGAWMEVGEGGLLCGTVGGGKIEGRAIELAVEKLSKLNRGVEIVSFLQKWDLQRDIGMTCGGVVSLFFDFTGVFSWRLRIFGAGHIVQELIPVLANLDMKIIVLDHRSEWLDRIPDFENVEKIFIDKYEKAVDFFNEGDWLLSLSQGHAVDSLVLKSILSKYFPLFVGVIGSKSKRKVLEGELREGGITEDKISKMVCPVGIGFVCNNPYEIAISIVAQLLSLKRGK